MRTIIRRFIQLLSMLAGAAFAFQASAVYVYTIIDYPGATFTDVRGLNNAGQIAGYASMDGGVTNFSFTYSGGVFGALPASPALPAALGMNDAGVIVGATEEPTGARGFIFNAGAYTFFTRPGWTTTQARAIGNSGLVTGYSTNEDALGTLLNSSGFIYNPATAAFTDIPVPPHLLIIAQGINAAGQVVGSATGGAPGGSQGFLRQPDGTITKFQVSGSSTHARGINDLGLITGFVTIAGADHGFVANSLGFQLLDVPGAASTFGESINNAGQVSGLWFDAADNTHGFIATPVSLPTGTTSGGAYVFSVAVVPNVPIFIDPPVAVGYDYDIGKTDPRIATVRLPIGIGDSFYSLTVDDKKFRLAGGDLFDFRTHGFSKGVKGFTVGCIEVSAGLDPANAQAFPTELTFVSAGRFTGTQKPLTRNASGHGDGHSPENSSCKNQGRDRGEHDD